MTEKLFTGTLNHNQNKKKTSCLTISNLFKALLYQMKVQMFCFVLYTKGISIFYFIEKKILLTKIVIVYQCQSS